MRWWKWLFTPNVFVDRKSGKAINLEKYEDYKQCPKCGRMAQKMSYIGASGELPEYIHCSCWNCAFEYDMATRS